MRAVRIGTAMLLGWALAMPPALGQSAEDRVGNLMTPTAAESQMPQGDIPIYKPRKQNAPKGRIGGGIRGGDGPALYVLAPDHVGFTKEEHPSLFWYLSKTTTLPLEFTLTDTRATKPIIEKPLSAPVQPGVQRISLKELKISLEPGVQYKWFITLNVGSESFSKNVVVGGTIERIPFIEALSIHMGPPAKNGDAVNRYAEAGLWYDAIATLSDMIEATPDDRKLKKYRASLLQQVGLWEVAKHDSQD